MKQIIQGSIQIAQTILKRRKRMRLAAGMVLAVALTVVMGCGDKDPVPPAVQADAEDMACVSPEEKAIAKAIAEDLVCVCPTCDEPSLATCECDFAQKQRGYIGAALALGFSREEIVDALVAKFGNRVLATPPPQEG